MKCIFNELSACTFIGIYAGYGLKHVSSFFAEPELSEPTLSKAAMKRGLLKRMQRVEGSTEVLPEVNRLLCG